MIGPIFDLGIEPVSEIVVKRNPNLPGIGIRCQLISKRKPPRERLSDFTCPTPATRPPGVESAIHRHPAWTY